MYLRIPVVIGHEAEKEGQKLEFLAQSPLWSGEDSVWRSSHQPPFNNIEINTKREVTPNDERQSYSKVAVRIAAECPGWVDLGTSTSGGPSSLPERPESARTGHPALSDFAKYKGRHTRHH